MVGYIVSLQVLLLALRAYIGKCGIYDVDSRQLYKQQQKQQQCFKASTYTVLSFVKPDVNIVGEPVAISESNVLKFAFVDKVSAI